MKRAFSAIFCCAMLLALSGAANADPASDRDMANRYLQAARSGDDDAQFYVAALYSAGVGVPRSDEEAFRWFARAADQGHSHAMLIVGGLYAIGRGVEKDNVKAYQYAYIVNSATKVEEFRNGSRQLLGVLESKMTPDEVSRARAEAGRWRPVSNAPPQQPPPPPLRRASTRRSPRRRPQPRRPRRRRSRTRSRRPRPTPLPAPIPMTSPPRRTRPARPPRKTTSIACSIRCRRGSARDSVFKNLAFSL